MCGFPCRENVKGMPKFALSEEEGEEGQGQAAKPNILLYLRKHLVVEGWGRERKGFWELRKQCFS